VHKTRDKAQQKVNRESPRLIRKKTFLEKRNSENVKDYFERLVFRRPQIARIEVNFEINFPSVNTTFHADSNSGIFVLVGRIKPKIKPSKQSIMRVHD
jgi:hypothetical protein